MASIIYDDTSPRSPMRVNYHKINANKGFLTHTYNLMTLQWIRDHTDDHREARQCDHEITIAQRKIHYHRKHPNFQPEAVAKDIKKLQRQFQSEGPTS
jgi:hypothetical protein